MTASTTTTSLPSCSLPRILLLVLVLTGLARPALATIYFVDTDIGNDAFAGQTSSPGNVGSGSGPWRSLARVAAAVLQPGDEVRLHCGQVWAETLRINQSGVNGLPILLGAYPEPCTNKPRIDGTIVIPADNWERDHGAVYRVRLPVNLVTNGALDRSVTQWAQVQSGAKGKLVFNKVCPKVAGGCLSFTSPAKVKGLLASPRFTLRAAARYRLSYSVFVPKGKNAVLRLRRSGPTDLTALASAIKITGSGTWQTRTVDFVARNGATDARFDVEVPAQAVTVMLRAVAVQPLTGVPNNLLMAGRDLQPGHHPNFGFDPLLPNSVYLKTTADSNQVTDNLGTGSTFLTTGNDLVLPPGATLAAGMQVRMRSENWNLDERTITTVNGTRIDFTPKTTYRLQADWGYFFVGAAWMVDSPDEWFFDSAHRTLTVWMPDSANPGARLAYASLGTGIDLTGLHDVVVDNLAVRGTATGVDASTTARITMRNLRIEDSAGRGLSFKQGQSIKIENSVIVRTRLDAINACKAGAVECGSHNSVTNNTIVDSGVQVANAKVVSLPTTIDGAISLGADATVSGNKLVRSGTYGVFLRGNSTIASNSFTDTCLTLDDCAAVYSNMASNGSTFTGNFVRGVWGNIAGTPYTATRSVGIYLDDQSQGMVVDGNTLLDADNGIQVHNAFNNVLRNNAFYGNRRFQLWFQEGSHVLRDNGDIHGNVVSNNVLVPTADAPALRHETILADTHDFATYTGNVYSVLLGTNVAQETYPDPANSTLYTMSQWQSATVNGTPRNSDASGRAIALEGFTTFRTNGGNIIPNGDLSSGLGNWSRFNQTAPLAAMTLVNCGASNCVQIVAGAPTSLLSSHNFAVTKDQFYRVSFDASTGVEGETITVVPRKGGGTQFINQNGNLAADFGSIGPGVGTITFTGSVAMKRYSFIFKAAVTVTLNNNLAARVDFAQIPNGHTLRVDNLEMVAITPVDATALKTAIVYNDNPAASVERPCPDAATAPANCSRFVKLLDATPVSFPYHLEPLAHEIFYTRDPDKVDTDNDGIANTQDLCVATPANLAVNARGCAISQ